MLGSGLGCVAVVWRFGVEVGNVGLEKLGIKKAGIARFPAFILLNVFLFLFGLEFFGFLRNLVAQNLMKIMLYVSTVCKHF
jgi:hypothetical protein